MIRPLFDTHLNDGNVLEKQKKVPALRQTVKQSPAPQSTIKETLLNQMTSCLGIRLLHERRSSQSRDALDDQLSVVGLKFGLHTAEMLDILSSLHDGQSLALKRKENVAKRRLGGMVELLVVGEPNEAVGKLVVLEMLLHLVHASRSLGHQRDGVRCSVIADENPAPSLLPRLPLGPINVRTSSCRLFLLSVLLFSFVSLFSLFSFFFPLSRFARPRRVSELST